MSAHSPRLPGKLGDPKLTLASGPRLDPRLLEAVGGFEATLDEQTTAGPDSLYEEIIDFIGELESGIDAVFVEELGSLRPVSGVDGNEIRPFIHEPAERKGPLRSILHTHGGGMAMCTAADGTPAACPVDKDVDDSCRLQEQQTLHRSHRERGKTSCVSACSV